MTSHIIFIKPHEKFSQNVLDLFSSHKIEFPDMTREDKFNLSDIKYGVKSDKEYNSKQESKMAKKELKNLRQEKENIVKTHQAS